MYTRTIEYEDFNGEKHSDTFYFNMTEAETMEWVNETVNVDDAARLNPAEFIEKMQSKDISTVDFMRQVKDLICRSYGVKSVDGKRFIKSKAVTDEFLQTEAYSVLYMDLLTNPDSFSEFFLNGIIPKKLMARIEEVRKEHPEIPSLS